MYKLSKSKVIIILILFLFPFISILIGDLTPINFGKLYTLGMSIKDFLGIWITVWGAIGVAVNIYIHTKRLDKMDQQVKLQSKANQHAQFSKAVELLGSDNLNIRLGAISLLGFVVRDFPEYKDSVYFILNNNLRSMLEINNSNLFMPNSIIPSSEESNYTTNLNSLDIIEIQHIIDILCKEINGRYLYKGYVHDFSNMIFKGNHRSRISFNGALLKNAIFKGAALSDVSFYAADLSGADFSDVEVYNVIGYSIADSNVSFKTSSFDVKTLGVFIPTS
jgi:uncharacterized protein YjbI with pentapeptide repeats